jgi:hypothetical protein
MPRRNAAASVQCRASASLVVTSTFRGSRAIARPKRSAPLVVGDTEATGVFLADQAHLLPEPVSVACFQPIPLTTQPRQLHLQPVNVTVKLIDLCRYPHLLNSLLHIKGTAYLIRPTNTSSGNSTSGKTESTDEAGFLLIRLYTAYDSLLYILLYNI